MTLSTNSQHGGTRIFGSDGDPIAGNALNYNDPLWEIARTGKYRGKTANLGWMFARRVDGWSSTAVMGDVAEYLDTSQASVNPTVLGTPYYLVSTSAQDGVGGTGIRTVYVNCLTTALGTRTIREITLNGTTPVLLGNDILHVQYLESGAIGSGGVAAGDIYCSTRDTAGTPTVAQRIDMIKTGNGRSCAGRLMVPGGFTAYLIGWHASAVGNTMDVRIRGQAFTHNRALSPGFHFQETAWLGSGQSFTDDFHFLPFPALSVVKLSAIPGGAAAGNRCEGSFHFVLIED